jgi:hypothetical protein
MKAIEKVAKEQNKVIKSLSLGKGQDVKAKKLIKDT